MNTFINKLIIIFTLCFYAGNALYAADSSSLVSEIFLKRHSGKLYDPNKTVSTDELLALIEAARWSPSSYNDQPWNFIICNKNSSPEAYLTTLESLQSNKSWAENAPILMVVVVRTKGLYKGKPNEWADYDTGASAMSLSLQAADLGLMVHQIGGFDKKQIAEYFQIPADFKPVTVLVVGYESEEPDPDAKPRERRPIGENFFDGEWGRPFSPESGS